MREVATDVQFCPFCGAAAPKQGGEVDDPYVGQTVAQKYLVHQLVDRGGMGVVYKATHLSLDRPVALKMLNRALLADPTVVARFHREARAASRLNHPNSISVIDFGQTDDGTLFMALEFLPGRTLRRVITDEFPLGARRVVKIGSQILAALTQAHALGVLHCDIKPENVMLESRHDEKDVVKVLDFGIAKLRDAASPKLTREGMACGTPGYASPEQARGEELDPRSDLYSVGVVLYELLAGKLPFDAATPGALMAKMLVEPPVPLRIRRPDLHVPANLEGVIMRALSPDREARIASANLFRRELLACGDTGERPAPMLSPQGTALFDAAAGDTPPGQPRPARPATPPVPQSAARTPEALRPTPRHRAPGSRPHRGVGEVASAVTIIFGSVAGALLVGALVWYGLTRIRGGDDDPAGQLEPVAARNPPASAPQSPAVTPAPVPRPAASRGPSAPSPQPAHPPRKVARPGHAPGAERSPSSARGILVVLGSPGASITVDGQPTGVSPRELQLAPGPHRVRASHPDLGSAEETVEVVAGQRTRWTANLAR